MAITLKGSDYYSAGQRSGYYLLLLCRAVIITSGLLRISCPQLRKNLYCDCGCDCNCDCGCDCDCACVTVNVTVHVLLRL
jgi:hypothetical protein